MYLAWKSTLPCLHFEIHNSNYTTEAPCRVQSYSLAHSLVVSCCNKIQELYWVEPPSHGQWTLMNPQILRRVEDPCRTQQHMRRGIQFLGIGKRKALPQFIKGKALLPPTPPPRRSQKGAWGRGMRKPPQPRRGNRPTDLQTFSRFCAHLPSLPGIQCYGM